VAALLAAVVTGAAVTPRSANAVTVNPTVGIPPGLCGLNATISALLGCTSAPDTSRSSSTSSPAPSAAGSPATAQLQAAPPVIRTSARATYVPNVVVVRFEHGVSDARVARLLARIGARTRERIPALGIRVVSVASVQRARAALNASPLVADATRDEVMHVFGSVPDDAFFSYQWGFRQAGFTSVWQSPPASRSVLVAVLDTGVDAAQPDLAGAVRPGLDLLTGDSNAGDDNGHGTAVAGVIAAIADNGLGGAGVCRACSILPIKVMGSDGNGDLATVAAGIVRAADMHARVIDLSLGGPTGLDALQQAVAYAIGKGAVVVAAAGNSGKATPFFPAGYPGVIAVAGSNQSDRLYGWSERGPWITLTAPGCNVAPLLHGGYGNFCGTSSATPLVAGLVGLLFARHPSASNLRVAHAIEQTARRTHTDVRFGRIAAATAVAALR
jgi:subtilisin family serine protease